MMATRTEVLSPDLDAIGDWTAPEGSEPWAKALRIGMQMCVDKVAMYPGQLKGLVEKATKYSAWTKLTDEKGKPFKTFDEFCAKRQPYGLGTPYEKLKPYLLAAHDGNAAVVAAVTTRPEAAPTHSDAGKKGGRPKRAPSNQVEKHDMAPGEKAPDDRKGFFDQAYGNRIEYLAARIARDAPEVHEGMKAGKFKSVRAAAKAAGIVKDPDAVKVAIRAILKVPTTRFAELAHALPADTRRTLLTCLKDAS